MVAPRSGQPDAGARDTPPESPHGQRANGQTKAAGADKTRGPTGSQGDQARENKVAGTNEGRVAERPPAKTGFPEND